MHTYDVVSIYLKIERALLHRSDFIVRNRQRKMQGRMELKGFE